MWLLHRQLQSREESTFVSKSQYDHEDTAGRWRELVYQEWMDTPPEVMAVVIETYEVQRAIARRRSKRRALPKWFYIMAVSTTLAIIVTPFAPKAVYAATLLAVIAVHNGCISVQDCIGQIVQGLNAEAQTFSHLR